MHDYFIFGGCFRSELEFPDLSPFQGNTTPDWELRVSSSAAVEPGELQGERILDPAWVLRLYRLPNGWRLEYGASGSYEVLSAGRQIIWHQGTDRREEVVRAVVLGPIMALALHESGILCLHGSAVALDGNGIGFLAPKGYGKSTLALALTAIGGQLMSDDLLAVTTSTVPKVLPGVHSVRMHSDVTDRLYSEFPGASLRDGWKHTLTNLPQHRLGWDSAILEALYMLGPIRETSSEQVVRRTRLPPMEAAFSLATHTKITDLVSHLEEGKMLRWITQVVARVPVYRLEVSRDLDRLPSVAEQIVNWHAVKAP